MASPLVFKAPRCLSCIRGTAGSFGVAFLSPVRQQIRGKKQLAKEKANTVVVRILMGQPGFGKKGK